MAIAYIYGLREKTASDYFYVGSSRVSASVRHKAHVDGARTDKARNRHLSRKIRKLGSENIVCDVLEEVPADVQFEREYFWIAKLRDEGHHLTNIKLIPDYEFSVANSDSYAETYREIASCPDWTIKALTILSDGPGAAIHPSSQNLLEQLYRFSVLCFKSLANKHWDEYLSMLGLSSECEQSKTIAMLIRDLP